MTDYQRWIRSLIKEAEKLGWTVINNGHLKFKSPEGKIVVCSNSPKCESTRFSVARDLRRAGFPI